jgi:D-methionine transport system ATP-binding protein
MTNLLDLKQVSLAAAIGSHYFLQEISFRVSGGDRMAIIGASGAGKTSLLRLINRLQDPTTGVIDFEGKSLKHFQATQLRQQIVLVPQEPKLLGMTVRDAIAYPLVLQQLPKPEIQQRLKKWLTKLHIPEDWLDRNELQLSLGQRQLVTIVRALAMEPKVFLLDEPTSALDAGIADHLTTVLIDLGTNAEMAILMVNHQLEIAQKFANRVLYLQQGQLLEDKTSDRVDWLSLRENLIQQEAQKRTNDELDEF